jgi:cardiolipin synthase
VAVLVCIRIVYDTRSNVKTLGYLLLVLFVPIAGILIYFTFGINYRKHKMYSKKLVEDVMLVNKLKESTFRNSKMVFDKAGVGIKSFRELALLLIKDSLSPLMGNNDVRVLVNGEKKFPEVINALKAAKDHIHVEYYIYDDDEIGREIENVLIQKAREGVRVRFVYDDFGSRSIRRKMVGRMRNAGIAAFPFYKIRFIAFANRLNYRNHRKIIVIDGVVAFVGGINVSDRYVNNGKENLFWRDTHLRIEGPGVHYLQYLFLCDWNFCASQQVKPEDCFFPDPASLPHKGDKILQIAASGPDSDSPTILYSLLQAIHLAEEEILITTPYFIPGESIQDALIVSAMGGVSIKLLVPGISDSKIVNLAARSYYSELLTAGVEIYLYQKGFVHAKSIVVDRKLAIVGTANMDIRSFDLNFEVNAIVYDEETAITLADIFTDDIGNATKINADEWNSRSMANQLLEKTARLVSPLL